MAESKPEAAWTPLNGVDPYGHFWWPLTKKGTIETSKTSFAGDPFESANVDLFEFLEFQDSVKLLLQDDELAKVGNELQNDLNTAQAFFGGGKWIAIPSRIKSLKWIDKGKQTRNDWVDDEFRKRLPCDLPDDAIIVGLIDTGIPLHHRRTMMPTDRGLRSRIVASWQQSATITRKEDPGDVPFGATLTGPEIDALLETHISGPQRYLDETAFNREAKLVEPNFVLGHRDLDFRGSNGAHVMDLAAGMDPLETNEQILNRVRFVVVNLPPQFLYGTAGNFLQYYASFALQWIADVTEALTFDKPTKSHESGIFPLAVNLSFGMQAGPKDGALPYEMLAREIIRGVRFRAGLRKKKDKQAATLTRRHYGGHQPSSPKTVPFVRLSMPAGNSNLERGSARLELKRGEIKWLEWRILPQDQTANFVEIWSDPIPWVKKETPTPEDLDEEAKAWRIHLAPPGEGDFSTGEPMNNRYVSIGSPPSSYEGFAKLYCQVFSFMNRRGDVDRKRIRFLIAFRSTENIYDSADTRPTAPAGLWRIGLESMRRSIGVDLNIQSDQSRLIHSSTGLTSYFDHPAYQIFDSQGRLKDSFDYDPISGRVGHLEVGEGPVRRIGTVSAMSSTPYATTIGGYRRSDGKPADYSASGYIDPDRASELRRADVAFPTDDGASHPGILAAGASDGSTVSYMGTSMGSALATRRLVEELLKPGLSNVSGNAAFGRGWYGRLAEVFEADRPDAYGPAAHAKTGRGRLPYPSGYTAGRVERLSENQIPES